MPEADAVLTTWPEPCSISRGRKTRLVRTVPSTLRSSTRRHSSTGMASGRPATITPTLFTTTSMLPNSASTRSRAASNSASRATSQRCAHAEPPAVVISSATTSARCSSTSVTRTREPRPASSRAMARPMPLPAPVTNAAAPSRSNGRRSVIRRRYLPPGSGARGARGTADEQRELADPPDVAEAREPARGRELGIFSGEHDETHALTVEHAVGPVGEREVGRDAGVDAVVLELVGDAGTDPGGAGTARRPDLDDAAPVRQLVAHLGGEAAYPAGARHVGVARARRVDGAHHRDDDEREGHRAERDPADPGIGSRARPPPPHH